MIWLFLVIGITMVLYLGVMWLTSHFDRSLDDTGWWQSF